METADRLVSLAAIHDARERIADRVHRTPMLASATAARVLRAAGGPGLADEALYVKADHLQKTGSFKARGMSNRILTLSDAAKRAGVITVSAGNAAQACAWAARAAGVPATVIMPEGAVRSKHDACLGYGADVIIHGSHVGEMFAEQERLSAEHGYTFVHPFDDPELIAGHGSAGLEILDDLPDVDVVVVPVGGGGLISGIATAVKESRPATRVYGIEPAGANAMRLALDAGEPVRIQPRTVADGLSAPFAGEWTLAAARRYLDDVIAIDDATILGGLRFALERMKQVLEPAGAAALAAVLFGKVPVREGETVCVVASGGNVEVGRIGQLLEAAAPLPVAGD
ncbi:MAG TPA: pyridoxal-phosphate dependent enzyme [Candidatus Limnocylindrales bacterium]|nr:pyridoxal-phosphate dependent enzyme [Candidatus Limnocylindrales bacterium]